MLKPDQMNLQQRNTLNNKETVKEIKTILYAMFGLKKD